MARQPRAQPRHFGSSKMVGQTRSGHWPPDPVPVGNSQSRCRVKGGSSCKRTTKTGGEHNRSNKYNLPRHPAKPQQGSVVNVLLDRSGCHAPRLPRSSCCSFQSKGRCLKDKRQGSLVNRRCPFTQTTIYRQLYQLLVPRLRRGAFPDCGMQSS